VSCKEVGAAEKKKMPPTNFVEVAKEGIICMCESRRRQIA